MKLEDSIDAAIQILEMNPDWIYIYDLQQNINIYENNKSLKFLGYNKEEFAAMQHNLMGIILHPDDILKIKNYHNHIQYSKKNNFSIEYRVKNKVGEYRIFSSNDTPYKRDNNGRITQIIGTARDITRQHQLLHLLTSQEDNEISTSRKKYLMHTLAETNKIKSDELRLLQSSLEIIKRSRLLKQQADELLGKMNSSKT